VASAAVALRDFAYSAGSTDNLSVVIVFLQQNHKAVSRYELRVSVRVIVRALTVRAAS
jgi:hypothetical protein